MPKRVEIVEPFTRVRSFDQDAEPDGIELIVQAFNALDNPGLMIAGGFQIGLYEHIQGSADRKGRRLEHWEFDLITEADQRRYWNALTQMYEFRIAVDASRIPPGEKYVLSMTYNSPVGEHMTDECLIVYRGGASPGATVTR